MFEPLIHDAAFQHTIDREAAERRRHALAERGRRARTGRRRRLRLSLRPRPA
jgi:hypothetical protein